MEMTVLNLDVSLSTFRTPAQDEQGLASPVFSTNNLSTSPEQFEQGENEAFVEPHNTSSTSNEATPDDTDSHHANLAPGPSNCPTERKEESQVSIAEGLIFESYDEFLKEFELFKKRNFVTVYIADSKSHNKTVNVDKNLFPKRYVIFKCVNGRNVVSVTNNIRPNVSYNGLGCPFHLHLVFDPKKKHYIIRTFKPQHLNHELSEEAYNAHPGNCHLTGAEVELYIRGYLIEGKCAKSNVVKMIRNKTGKHVTVQLLSNHLNKLLETDKKGDMELTHKLLQQKKDEDHGAAISVLYDEAAEDENDEDRAIRAIFYQSSAQMKLFSKYPNPIFVDGTYNCTNRGFILVPILSLDNQDNSRLVAWSLVSNETQDLLTGIFEQFKQSNELAVKETKVALVDKNFSEINSLQNVLPHVHFFYL
jgi:hypothetical protein